MRWEFKLLVSMCSRRLVLYAICGGFCATHVSEFRELVCAASFLLCVFLLNSKSTLIHFIWPRPCRIRRRSPISSIKDLVCADPCFLFRSHLGFADQRFAFDLRLMLRIAFLILVSSFTNRLCRVWFVYSFVLGVVVVGVVEIGRASCRERV